MCADASAQEIRQKTVVKYGVELRSELLGNGLSIILYKSILALYKI